jgi:flavorubredoxin
MKITEIAQDTHQLTMNVENILFEGVWDIPNGVSLNSYVIRGDKTAIIDGVCGWDGVPESLLQLLEQLEVDPSSVEYLIVNHTEPDHSGWIEAFRKLNPDAQIICSKKAKELLTAFFGEVENITVVKEADTLDLGKGHVLQFAEIPNVHWPDTIATLDTYTGTLFSCDAFGSFGNITTAIYADELTEDELNEYETDTLRYYSNIVATFSPQVKKAVAKCETLPIKLREPAKIMKAYSDYADYQKGPARKEITLIWGSMYGMTGKAVDHVVNLLEKEDIKVHVHNVPYASWGTVLTSAWTSSAIILAMPTYEFKMFPPMASVLEELGKKKVNNRKAFRFGSYGWSGGAQKELDEIMTRLSMNWDFIEPVEFMGSPKDSDMQQIEERVQELTKYIKEL